MTEYEYIFSVHDAEEKIEPITFLEGKTSNKNNIEKVIELLLEEDE